MCTISRPLPMHAPVVMLISRTRLSQDDVNTPSPHVAPLRTLPNAVALAATPLLAAAPAPRHVPVPATTYVMLVAAATPTRMHRSKLPTAKSPLGSSSG
jgi:hypothetical protein